MNASCMHNNGDYLGVLDAGYKNNGGMGSHLTPVLPYQL